MDRRTFLKTAGLGSIAVAYGCDSNHDKNIFSLVTAPEDFVTGQAVWYASTCMECPAGCGIIAKNREGRVIKLEGNPAHPVNQGKLCIRGQAALQSVYDPDRLTLPQLKTGRTFKSISFDQAFDILKERMQASSKKGSNRIKMMTGITSDPLSSLFSTALKAFDSSPAVMYEPYSHDALKAAHKALFSTATLPSFHMEKADFILGFGADFIETWLSPVEYIRKFKSMHAEKKGKKGVFIHAGPYMSLTAANADKFLPITAGQEYLAALGIMRQILKTETCDHLPYLFVGALKGICAAYDSTSIQEKTGLLADDQKQLARLLISSDRPLVLGSAGATNADSSLALDMVATLINLMLDKDLSLYDFEKRHSVEQVMTAKETTDFFKTAVAGTTDLLLFYNTNPLFTFPINSELTKIFNQDDIFKVSFSNFLDETSNAADLIFPVQLPLETWDSYKSNTACISTLQPAMGQMTKAPSVGDVFLKLSGRHQQFEDYYQYLADYLYTNMEGNSKTDFIETIQKGGIFPPGNTSQSRKPSLNERSLSKLKETIALIQPFEKKSLNFLAVPSLRLYDGRGANKSWLNEIPDPVTNIAWETMLMIHPSTLGEYGFTHGDILKIEAENQTIKAPVYSYTGVAPELIVMQIGQGHKSYGRYAAGFGSSPIHLLSSNPINNQGTSNFLSYLITPTLVKKTGTAVTLPQTDGSRSQYHRKIALSVTRGHDPVGHKKEEGEGLDMNRFPLTLPTKDGYDKKRDIYPSHDHEGYRWGMIVDLDRCVGCSACVAACYAENNIGVVGKTQLAKGREMAWLRIERYQDQTIEEKLIFLPMMCQHCDAAPCESVCPVYASHHSKEGLNNQVYNRCIGTRFCAQNCPYKVRKFNWFDWERPKPLNLQLNPDVTDRSKGVMEKCSFCVQRIKRARNQAKNENRKIRDKEVQPACVQTCPANALTFGSFLDENSAVSTLARDERAYQVLGYLNTKSAVIYLKKVVQEL
ncbi:MAG: 4Fe-4S dicluster domain-containing protein [Deltaproteobacteria bacterium]|jgi:anaerobic selenocysteine-containing dehydrogenase/Fe-S-cluster-containing dehydrogenase component|nr:4Fe-4S dicluster domain-containing protein [Deltaproteobacteria bacterium]